MGEGTAYSDNNFSNPDNGVISIKGGWLFDNT
jgi:hypothetical protein